MVEGASLLKTCSLSPGLSGFKVSFANQRPVK